MITDLCVRLPPPIGLGNPRGSDVVNPQPSILFFLFLGRIQPSILWGSNMKIREQVGYPPNRGILPTAKRALNASCIKRLVGKPKLVSSYTCIFQVLQRSYKNISKRINII